MTRSVVGEPAPRAGWTRSAGTAIPPLPIATPESQGVPSGAVAGFLDSAAAADIDLHSVEIVRHGHRIAAGWWAPYRPGDLVLKYSLSKSFTSTCVGLAAAADLLSVDDPACALLPEYLTADAGPRARSLTVRHLLSMATGHENDTIAVLDRADPVRSFFAIEPEAAPGSLFTYNNGATLVLSAIVTSVTGRRLLDVAGSHLLGPLGAAAAHWDGAGSYDSGFSGLHIDTDTVVRLGLTYLGGGSFAGRRIVPAWWVQQASAVQVTNADRGASVDWQQGYGFQFWRSTHGFRGDGAYGQFCLVLPDEDAVIVTTGAVEDMQSILDRVWRLLLPAFSDGPLPPDPAAAGALDQRLADLEVPLGPAAGGARSHPAGAWSLAPSGRPADTLAIAEVRLDSGGGSGGSTSGGGNSDRWGITLDDGIGRYRVPVGAEWARSEHRVGEGILRLASAGSWTGPDEFTAQVVLANTPHRFAVRCDLRTARADLIWHTPPLEDRRLSGRALPAAVQAPE